MSLLKLSFKISEKKCKFVWYVVYCTFLFIQSHPYIKDNEDCRPIVIDALKLIYELELSEERLIDLTDPLSRPRIPFEILFAIGGWSGGSPTSIIEIYDARAECWSSLSCNNAGKQILLF